MILTSQQLTCLASPARNEVFVTIRSLREASAADIAEAGAWSSEAVQFHLRELLKSGLIRVKYRRPTSRRTEAVYESSDKEYRLPDVRKDPELAALTRKSVAAGLRQTVRGYLAATERVAEAPESAHGIQIIRATARLSLEDTRAFLGLLNAASEFAKRHETPDGERLCWTSVVYPPGRRQSGVGKK